MTEKVIAFLLFVATPGAPESLAIMEKARTSVKICWKKPVREGGAPIDSYVIERSEGRYNVWMPVDKVSGIRYNYTVSGLMESSQYTFRVAAVNAAGRGDWATVKVSTAEEQQITIFFCLLWSHSDMMLCSLTGG